MDMISKFQLGGGFESLFTIYKPIQTELPRRERDSSRLSESKKDKDDTKGKLTEKDLFDMLEKLDGLPNEMLKMLGNMITTLNNAKAMGVTDILDLASTYLRNLYSLKEAKYNKEQFDNTYLRAVANGSLNEAAIDASGLVWVTTLDGGITSMSPSQWAKAKESGEYQLLTNGNLLWMRSHLPLYANKNQLFRIVENGIGLEQVHKMIKDRFHEIGKNETSTDTFIPKEAVKGALILELMLQLGPDGYYKFTQELSTSDKNQVYATLNYIYSTLPANAKTRLAIETKDGTLDSVIGIINDMITGTLSTKQTYSAQYIGTDEKFSGKSKDGTTGDEDNYATKIVKGYGTPETFGIDLGDGNSTFVHANIMPFKGGKDDNSGGENKPISLLMEGSLGSLLDLRSMSIGGGLISSYNLKHIINTDAKVRTLDYPCTVNSDGSVVPAFSKEVRERKAKAEEALKNLGINPYNYNLDYIRQNYLAINLAYQNQQLPAPYNADGTPNNRTWARFAVIAVATDGKVAKNADKSLLQEITDDRSVEGIIAAIQDSDKNYNPDVSGWSGNNDTFYEGTLWIRLMPGYNAATATLRSDAAVTRQRDEYDLALANRATLTTQQFY